MRAWTGWSAAMLLGVLGLADAHAEPPQRAVGIASWYGAGHQGRRTASGETFRMEALTAAHRTLPLGTAARIVNLDNGRSVDVVINDRGPTVAGRLVDVSAAAATRLGMLARGLARVAVTPID